MDPTHPCADLNVTVTPAVEEVDAEPPNPCKPMTSAREVIICAFGASRPKARLTFALLGDSHTYAWRAALNDLGQSQGWRGYSFAAPACIFSDAAKLLQARIAREPCLKANRATMRWLALHREIDFVVTIHEADTVLNVPAGKNDAAKISGFRRTWKAFPVNVRRVIVLRDTPNASAEELACVARVSAAAMTPPGPACAVPRASALTRDVAVEAAHGLHAARYAAVDMTDLICSTPLCYPAVGGVLVNRDLTGHITQTFARTTEPYLLSRMRPLLPRPRTRR